MKRLLVGVEVLKEKSSGTGLGVRDNSHWWCLYSLFWRSPLWGDGKIIYFVHFLCDYMLKVLNYPFWEERKGTTYIKIVGLNSFQKRYQILVAYTKQKFYLSNQQPACT